MLSEKLAERLLPALMTHNDGSSIVTPDDWRARRRELLNLLQREEYGFTPPAPKEVRGEILSEEVSFAGKATLSSIRLTFDTPGGAFSFPITLILPRANAPCPAFVALNFRPNVPDAYLPAEEIVDHGFAVAVLYYNDVTQDSDAGDGLAKMYPRDAKTGWGCIGMWAFAASRVLDYLLTRPEIDPSRVCVTGHSRLGKTALWCGAQDERFSMVISNDSGCSGAAISRGKVGESIEVISRVFPYWFCGNYRRWANREFEAPFDQHMLLSLVAPRKLYVCSAIEDTWADPESEFLSCLAASEAWKFLRVSGLVTPDAFPVSDQPLMDGGVCYHVRDGEHFFSRTDWLYHLACRERYHI